MFWERYVWRVTIFTAAASLPCFQYFLHLIIIFFLWNHFLKSKLDKNGYATIPLRVRYRAQELELELETKVREDFTIMDGYTPTSYIL